MGTYLSKPVTTKDSSHGQCRIGGRVVTYAVTAMQGWRVSMEVCACGRLGTYLSMCVWVYVCVCVCVCVCVGHG